MRQKMLTAEIIKKTPALYATEEIKIVDKIATAHFFNPCGIGDWYMIEKDQNSTTAFGLCHLHEWELGYFDIAELESTRLKWGLYIERDSHFTPRKLSEIHEVEKYLQQIA